MNPHQPIHLLALVTRTTPVPVSLIALAATAAAVYTIHRYGQHCRARGYIEATQHRYGAHPARGRRRF